MFPTNSQNYESIFDDFSSISCPPNSALENQFMGDASGESSGLNISTIGEKEQILAAPTVENNDEKLNKEEMKKVHKEIERKRRKEMASLHSTLRSLLPLEYIRGKRSISDHINESVKYIKDQEKIIQELSIKRDRLQTMLNSHAVSTSSVNSIHSMMNSVTIGPCCGGFEILITTIHGEDVFPLSRVLQVMLEESFDVASYVSTQVNGRLFSTIQFQADISRTDDLSWLQQKLIEALKYRP